MREEDKDEDEGMREVTGVGVGVRQTNDPRSDSDRLQKVFSLRAHIVACNFVQASNE